MNDLRAQLPECPLEYEVPFIPGKHTLVTIPIYAAEIGWQEKMLPWTLASLINNTDLVMQGVHLHIACIDADVIDRVQDVLSKFEFSADYNLFSRDRSGYNNAYVFNVGLWAFRNESNTHKLDIRRTLERLSSTKPYPDISNISAHPSLYDMRACTIEQFRHAIKQLMGAQLAMAV